MVPVLFHQHDASPFSNRPMPHKLCPDLIARCGRLSKILNGRRREIFVSTIRVSLFISLNRDSHGFHEISVHNKYAVHDVENCWQNVSNDTNCVKAEQCWRAVADLLSRRLQLATRHSCTCSSESKAFSFPFTMFNNNNKFSMIRALLCVGERRRKISWRYRPINY